jgi:hypothetical protein
LVLLGAPQIPNVFTSPVVWRDLEMFMLSFQPVKMTASRVLKDPSSGDDLSSILAWCLLIHLQTKFKIHFVPFYQ